MSKEITKQTISYPQLKNELIKLFESGNTDKGKCLEVLGSSYKIQIQRFYKTFNSVILEWQEKTEKATNEGIQANALESLKSGLKLKIERQLELQMMLSPDYLHEETALNMITGKAMKYHRRLEPREIIAIHKELSLMGGDYSPTKVANTDAKGVDKETTFTDEQLSQVLSKIK